MACILAPKHSRWPLWGHLPVKGPYLKEVECRGHSDGLDIGVKPPVGKGKRAPEP